MARFHSQINVTTGDQTQVPYTAEEEAAADAYVATTPAQLDQDQLNSALAAEGSVVRGLALVVLDIANGVIPIKTGAPLYTTNQLKNLIKAKMR
jgi:hypothetical protein